MSLRPRTHAGWEAGFGVPAAGVLALLLACAPSGAGVTERVAEPPRVAVRPEGLRLDDAWVEPGRAGDSTRAYLWITSLASMPIAVGASATPAASAVALSGRIATPPLLADRGGFVIPAGAVLQMRPGGQWLTLAGLKTSLVPGDSVRIALAFPDRLTIWVSAEVRAPAVALLLPTPSRRLTL